MNLRACADTLLAVLLAPPCAVCGRVLQRPLAGAVCDRCWDAVHPVTSPFALRGIRTACAIGRYDATLRDVVLLVRADEAHHRDVNHGMANELAGIAVAANPAPYPAHAENLRKVA